MNSVLNIVVCDDDDAFAQQVRKQLLRQIRDIPCNIITVNSGEELISLCEREKLDAVFLDIAMPGMSGFEAAEQIRRMRKDIILIFVSNRENMVYKSYEYQPFWFVPKTQMWLLENAVSSMITKLNEHTGEENLIQLKLGNRVVEVDINEIQYFCTEGHYTKYITRNGKVSDSFRCKISTVEEQLAEQWFVRAHSRFFVNLRCACSITGNMFELHNGGQLPISRSNMAVVKQKFYEYLGSI